MKCTQRLYSKDGPSHLDINSLLKSRAENVGLMFVAENRSFKIKLMLYSLRLEFRLEESLPLTIKKIIPV